MNVWWSQTMVQGVGWTLLHFLWQGLAIATLLAIGLRLLRSGTAQHRYLAGCAALLLMALAPLVTFQLVLKQDEPPPLPVVEPVAAEAPAPVERVAPPARTLPKIVVTATREPRAQKTSWRVESLMPWLVAAWFAGVCGLSCRLFAGWLQIRRLRNAEAEALTDGWPDKLKELARRLGVNRPLRLLRTACVEVPTVIGWLRPVILLPAACLTGLTTAQLESIIAHELAHIRRHDYLINLLQNAAETLLFYHPAVWWVSRRIREERENCCDDLVVEVCGDRVGYARALATLEELRPASAQLALAAGGAPLLQRIRRVLGQGERSAGRPAWPLAGVLVVMLLAAAGLEWRGHRAVAAISIAAAPAIEHKRAPATNDPNAELINILMDFAGTGTNAAGRDPWGNPYIITLDTNADNRIRSGYNKSAVLPLPRHTLRQALAQGTNNDFEPNFMRLDTNTDKWVQAGSNDLLQLEQRAAAASDGRMAVPVVKRAGNSRAMTVVSTTNLDGAEDPEIHLNPGQFVVHGTLPDGSSITSVLPLPHFRLRQVVTMTAVSGTNLNGQVDTESYWKPGEFIPQTLRLEDSTIILGDLPRVGELFQKNRDLDELQSNQIASANPKLLQSEAKRDEQNNLTSQAGISESNRVLFDQAVQLYRHLLALHIDEITSDSGKTTLLVDASGKTHVLKTAQNNPGSQAGMSNWIVDGTNTVDQASSATNSDRVQANVLVQDGRTYYEAGKYDEAEARFKQALKLDPANVAAAQYVGLILEKRDLNTLHKNDSGSEISMQQMDQEWKVEQRTRLLAPRTNGINRTNLIYTSKGRQTILSKLDRIRVDSVNYPDIPLKDVLDDLMKIAKVRDPDGKGINFFFNRAPVPQGTNTTAAQTNPDIEETRVKISLSDVRLADILDAITKTSEPPVTYSILDYAVEFSFRGTEPVPLETRTFHVDPNTFIQGLQGVTGKSFGAGGTNGTGGVGDERSIGDGYGPGGIGGFGGGGVGGGRGGTGVGLSIGTVVDETAVRSAIQASVRQYFSAAGVDLSTNNGKVVIFNDRKGTLTIRATQADLDLIEAAIQTLNTSPPEVNIKAKFVEITENAGNPIGFQWYLGGVKIGNAVGGTGTQPSLKGPVNNAGTNLTGNTNASVPNPIPSAVTSGGTNAPARANATGTITGILTDPQYRAVLQALDQRDGVDILTAPEITTESGRQAQVQTAEAQSIEVLDGTNRLVKEFHLGPSLDVLAEVSADEFSVHLKVTASVTEFLGFEKARPPVAFVPGAAAAVEDYDTPAMPGATGTAPPATMTPNPVRTTTMPRPGGWAIATNVPQFPRFRIRQASANASVWDAQTLVISGFAPYETVKVVDKVPVLGDIPLMGRLFRNEHPGKKKYLMIFITPTIINPDGTRYHKDEEMPFAKSVPPPQTGTNSVPKK